MKNNKYPLKNSSNKPRQVGFEIEYIDLSLDHSAEILHTLFGGKIKKANDHVIKIEGTKHGTFTVERDASFLQSLSETSRDNRQQDQLDLAGAVNDILTTMLDKIVPVEIVTPPLDFDQIDIVEQIVEELRQTSAQDTNKNLLSAFGLHINPELPSLETAVILNYLRAYSLLEAWLRASIDVDVTRQILPFIKEYPRQYIERILADDYQPSQSNLISDYIEDNKTRNHGLDMLPLFMHLDAELVKNHMDTQSIKARPTFHYRLPNASFRDSNWSVCKEWQRWLHVEVLANNQALLNTLQQDYLDMNADKGTWVKHINHAINNEK